MKKNIVLLLLLIVFILPGFSSYKMFDENLTFSWISEDSLHPESIVNPFSATSSLSPIYIIEGQPRFIRYANSDGDKVYKDVPIYAVGKYADEKLYLQLKTGVNIGVFNLNYKDLVESELGFQGSLNSVFQGFGGAKNLGFDGVFFFGLNTRLFNTASIRIGYQHYSGHYGDETIWNINKINPSQGGTPIEYTRDNNLLIGVSIQPISQVRLYADASLPLVNTWMHPAIHIPTWVIKRTDGKPLLDVEAGKENVTAPHFADSYKAWIINAGTELHYPINNLGSLFVAGEVTFNQDGQTLHTVGEYDSDNPWEVEYTVGAGIELEQDKGSSKARIMVLYHDGRFPLLNYFYQRTKYISLGLSLSL